VYTSPPPQSCRLFSSFAIRRPPPFPILDGLLQFPSQWPVLLGCRLVPWLLGAAPVSCRLRADPANPGSAIPGTRGDRKDAPDPCLVKEPFVARAASPRTPPERQSQLEPPHPCLVKEPFLGKGRLAPPIGRPPPSAPSH
jgi:hypothetical protein